MISYIQGEMQGRRLEIYTSCNFEYYTGRILPHHHIAGKIKQLFQGLVELKETESVSLSTML